MNCFLCLTLVWMPNLERFISTLIYNIDMFDPEETSAFPK